MSERTVLAWHFGSEKMRDGRDFPPDGEWLVHDGELVMCESGLHASLRLIDALRYAPGNTIMRVRLGGKMIEDTDKIDAMRRRIIWRIDGDAVLRAFARWCALQVIDKWDAPDVVVRYLRTGDKSIRNAAKDAALYGAWNAAWATRAARDVWAAWDAARDAARAIARAAWAAAWDAQNRQLEKMVGEARKGRTEWVFAEDE